MADSGDTARRLTSVGKPEIDENSNQLADFNDEIELLLSPGSPRFTSLYLSVSRTLYQYRISKLYSVAYIINEAYVRGRDAICRKGIRIRNPSAWLRKTCFHIVQELSRQENKYSPSLLDYVDEKEDLEDNGINSDFDLDREMMHVKLAFQLLGKDEREILNLKIVDGFTWKDIQKSFSIRGINISTSALRKRKERALNKLRDNYHCLTSAL